MPEGADVRQALDAERKTEAAFVDRVRSNEKAPVGWPAALLLFHVGMWRERLRNALTSISEGKDYERQPADPDAFNEAELVSGIGIPLTDAASRADHLLGELADLYEKVGDRPIEWGRSKTTTEALLRSGYLHARIHMYEYFTENGEIEAAYKLVEESVPALEAAHAPAPVLGIAVYNLATVRAKQGQVDEAIDLLTRALPLRPEVKSIAAGDDDLAGLRDDPRFKELVGT